MRRFMTKPKVERDRRSGASVRVQENRCDLRTLNRWKLLICKPRREGRCLFVVDKRGQRVTLCTERSNRVCADTLWCASKQRRDSVS